MTRAVPAELFTPDEARRHLDIVARDCGSPTVRLMSELATYHGGRERLPSAPTRPPTSAERSACSTCTPICDTRRRWRSGRRRRLWWALQVCNPVGLSAVVSNAAPRQSNVYFSSSDADFGDRVEAAARWSELRAGGVAVRGGWRLYSSGPGLFLHTVRGCLLGVRETFGDVVFDPVLPHSLDGLSATLTLLGRIVELRYRVRRVTLPPAIVPNGVPVLTNRENPYRPGGWRTRRRPLTAPGVAWWSRSRCDLFPPCFPDTLFG